MRILLALGLVVGVYGIATAADKNDPTLGKWIIESVTRDGKADSKLNGAVRVNDGTKYTITPPATSSLPRIEGTYVVDLSKSPVAIDVKPAAGQYKGKTLAGIVKVEGDTLTIAFAVPGKPRPTTFESKPGSGSVVAVQKRVK